jgi:hypothetical protein
MGLSIRVKCKYGRVAAGMRSTHEVGGTAEGGDAVSTTGFGGMGVPDGMDSLRDPKDTSMAGVEYVRVL